MPARPEIPVTASPPPGAPARLDQPLRLRSGLTLANRLAKASLTEQLSPGGRPSDALLRLWERWSRSGAGLLLTGNVMVDRRHLEHPGNVVLDAGSDLARFREWARVIQAGGSPAFVQINHPGRQCMRKVSKRPVAPSAVGVRGFGPLFAAPRALAGDEVPGLVEAWADAAKRVREAGFAGVEIHAAHGYLISQFLSPRTNQRNDAWGGTPGRRRRFLLEVVRAVRARVGDAFPVAVKLNSADFQRGGFDEEESLAVVAALDGEGIDLLEISGGSYESPAMMGEPAGPRRASTRRREAYFLAFAERVRAVTDVPLMVTGGFRTPAGMAEALASGALDVVGLGRPVIVEPDLPAQILAGRREPAVPTRDRVGIRRLDVMLQSFWFAEQLAAMGRGEAPDPRLNPWRALARGLARTI